MESHGDVAVAGWTPVWQRQVNEWQHPMAGVGWGGGGAAGCLPLLSQGWPKGPACSHFHFKESDTSFPSPLREPRDSPPFTRLPDLLMQQVLSAHNITTSCTLLPRGARKPEALTNSQDAIRRNLNSISWGLSPFSALSFIWGEKPLFSLENLLNATTTDPLASSRESWVSTPSSTWVSMTTSWVRV